MRILALTVLALVLGGCASGIQKDALKKAVAEFRPVLTNLEDRAGATPSERAANKKHLDTIEETAK